MNAEKFIEDIHAMACEEVDEILKKAEKDAACIIRDAEQKGKMIEQIHRDDAEKRIKSQKITVLFNVHSELKTRLNKEKYSVFESCFKDARDQLDGTRDREGYDALYKKLLLEAIQELDEPHPRIHIDVRDDSVCRDIIRELNVACEVLPDIESIGGLCISSPDEKTIVLNTLESRLERARELLKQEIFGILYGTS